MKKKIVGVVLFLKLILLLVGVKAVHAAEEDIIMIDPEIETMVIFSTEDWSMDENIRLLDLSLGHFSKNIEYKNVNLVEEKDLDDKTHLVYYGHIKEKLPSDIADMISSFAGSTLSIGYNVEQLGDKYSFLRVGSEQTVTKLEYLGDEEKTREIDPNIVFETFLEADADIIVEGSGPQGIFPLIMENEDNYYFASDAFDRPYSTYFSQMLNTFYDIEPIDKTPAYIRLEDVHPLSDPNRLRAVAEELKARDIPYMIAVTPVYTDPKSGRRHHFENYREVLDVLHYMQDNGGSVVLHGYTHQFRDSETGEGFEFWDVENQMPIYHGPEDEVVKLSMDDFESEEEYEIYMSQNRDFERAYIEERLTRGVQELANYGLYPLAFEAPHYTLSQHGYEVASEIFSTYVGQVQLSDERWEIMDTTPYASYPSILQGMLLLPETIGYVQPEAADPVNDMMTSVDYYEVTDGGMIGAFYHPYLGLDGLKELLDEMEQIENIEWINLKEMNNTVTVDHVSIQSGNGEIQADVNGLGLTRTSFDFVNYHIKEMVILVTWVIAVIGVLGVLMFFGFIFYQSVRQRRLERYVSKHSQIVKEE